MEDNIFPFESLYIFPEDHTEKHGGLTDQDMMLSEYDNLISITGSEDIMELIPECECAFKIDGPVCFSRKFVGHFGDVNNPKQVVDQLMKKYHVKSQYELLEKPEIVSKVGRDIIESEKDNFKIEGPWNSDELINDKNITGLMNQWHEQFPFFYPMPFEMIDFESEKDNPYVPTYLAKTDFVGLVKQGYTVFGLVINTDVWKNQGKHWFALVIDLRNFLDSLEKLKAGTINQSQVIPIQIEYFNSSGRDPKYQIHIKMLKILHEFSDYFRHLDPLYMSIPKIADVRMISELEIQKSHTECGVFSLIYIYSRLKNKPQNWFLDKGVKDKHMLAFRKRLFLNVN